MPTRWPFDDPPNVAVFADRKIIFGGAWIAYVSHDAYDGAWQFHTFDDAPVTEADAALVSLLEIIYQDESVVELADLPPGWRARRDTPASPWQRWKAD